MYPPLLINSMWLAALAHNIMIPLPHYIIQYVHAMSFLPVYKPDSECFVLM